MNRVEKIIETMKNKKKAELEATQPEQVILQKTELKIKEVAQTEQPEKMGLKQRMENIEKSLEDLGAKRKQGKVKEWKLPWTKRANLKKMAKRNMVLVHLLKENRTTTFSYAEIRDGMIMVNEKWRECALDFVWLLEGKRPEVILPEDSLQPIGTADFHKRLEDGSSGAYAEKIIIRALERAENEDKKKMGAKWVWIIIGAVIVVGFLLFYNQKK